VLAAIGAAPAVDVDGRAVALAADGTGWIGHLQLDGGTATLHVGALTLPLAVRRPPAAAIHLSEVVDPTAVNAAECASRVLGQLAAIRAHDATDAATAVLDVRTAGPAPAGAIELAGCESTAAPAYAAGDDAEAAGRIVASFLRDRGDQRLTVVVDASPRAQAVVTGARSTGVPVDAVTPDADQR